MLLAASGAATSAATAARHGFSFDPSSTLGWSVPVLLLIPLAGFALLLSGVRTRRVAVNFGFLTLGLMILDVLLVTWARWGKGPAYTSSFQWINLPVAFSGPPTFQGFGIDVAFAADHFTLLALLVLLVVMLGLLAWHRTAARAEPGTVRLPALWLLFALGGAGLVLANDLGELVAFWGLLGVLSYLLLNNRWGAESSTRGTRLALGVPFLADLALLCGVGLLYSRYGSLQVSQIAAGIGHTPGAGLKSLTVACALLLVAAFGRAGLFPFSSWLSGSVEAPVASVALMQGAWPLFSSLLLVKTMPVLLGAGPQAFRFGAWFCLVAVVLGPLLSWLGNDVRRAAVLSLSAASALGLLGLWQPGARVPAEAAVIAASLGRVCLVLSVYAIGASMRSWDLADLGEALARTPLAAYGAALGALVVSFAFAVVPASVSAGSGSSGSALRFALFGIGIALLAGSVWRGFAVAAFSVLRRRRAFEPSRVRDIAPEAGLASLGLGALGLIGVVLSFLTPWLAYLSAGFKNSASVGTLVLWLAICLVFSAVGLALYGVRSSMLLPLHARAGATAGEWWVAGLALFDAYLWRPGLSIAWGVESALLGRGESAFGPALVRSGDSLQRLPALPALAVAALLVAVAALVAGLVTSGIGR